MAHASVRLLNSKLVLALLLACLLVLTFRRGPGPHGTSTNNPIHTRSSGDASSSNDTALDGAESSGLGSGLGLGMGMGMGMRRGKAMLEYSGRLQHKYLSWDAYMERFSGRDKDKGRAEKEGEGAESATARKMQEVLQKTEQDKVEEVEEKRVEAQANVDVDEYADLIHDKYSIVVSTFNRIEHLAHFLGRTANGKLPRLDAIFIAWGLGGVDPPAWLDLHAYKVPVYLMRAQRNSLTERFRVPAEMRTMAGLWVDDDLQLHPEDLEFGFTAYRQLGARDHRITGYSGRQILLDEKKGKHSYELYKSSYSMCLTNNAFLDREMLKWFWNDNDERITKSIEYVDAHMNCEDILMNYVVSDKNEQPPLLVEAYDAQQLRTSGISNLPGHYAERSECIRAFTKIWGMPLKSTDIKVVPSTKEEHRRIVDLDPPFKKNFTPWAKGKKFVQPDNEGMSTLEKADAHDWRNGNGSSREARMMLIKRSAVKYGRNDDAAAQKP